MGREIQATGGSNHPATDAFFFFLFSSVVAPVQPSEQTSLKEHCGSAVFSSFFSSFFFFGSTASITLRYSSTISPCNNSAAIVMTLLRVQTDYQKRGANTNRGRPPGKVASLCKLLKEAEVGFFSVLLWLSCGRLQHPDFARAFQGCQWARGPKLASLCKLLKEAEVGFFSVLLWLACGRLQHPDLAGAFLECD